MGLLKGQRSTSQMTAFLVEGKLITDKKPIREMWADHFEALGTPSVSVRYNNDFLTRVTTSVKDIFNSCTEDLSGVLNEPLQYYEVEQVCSQLKPGVTGVSIDYELMRFAGPNLWVYHISCFKTSLILFHMGYFGLHTHGEGRFCRPLVTQRF